jgi:hypothetical protein
MTVIPPTYVGAWFSSLIGNEAMMHNESRGVIEDGSPIENPDTTSLLIGNTHFVEIRMPARSRLLGEESVVSCRRGR